MLAGSDWKVAIDGDKGYDLLGSYPSWQEARTEVQGWLESFIDGFVDPNTWGNEGPSREAVEDDLEALEALLTAPEGSTWEFPFEHDGNAYTLSIKQQA